MGAPRFLALALCGAAVSACSTYRLETPDQLYLGQAYLPLPSGFQVRDLPPNADDAAACAEPQYRPRDVRARREGLQPLAGMTLHVTESTYRRDAMDALPVLSDWKWRLPSPANCRSGPPWTRKDTLVVRHLLSVARTSAPTPDAGYFSDILRSGACTGTGCDARRLTGEVFDKVVANLKVVYREPQQTDDIASDPRTPEPAAAPATAPEGGLANWFRNEVVATRDGDFFEGAFGAQRLVDICAGIYGPRRTTRTASREELDRDIDEKIRRSLRAPLETASDGGDTTTATWETYRAALNQATQPQPDAEPIPPGVDPIAAEACNFSYKSLLLQPQDAWPPSPGTQKGDFVLLSTGDPLLMFRPLAHKALLDSSRRNVCPGDTEGQRSADCGEAQRVSQGFQDFELTFEVRIEGQRTPVAVTPSTSLQDLEDRYGDGRRIRSLRRPARWVPADLIVNDLQYKVTERPLAARRWKRGDALTVTFVPEGSTSMHGVNGVIAWESLKSRVLLAPGDEVTFARAGQ